MRSSTTGAAPAGAAPFRWGRVFPPIAALFGAVMLASPVHAAEGLYLTWNACAFEPSASAIRAFACDTDADTMKLHASFMVSQAVDSVIGIEAVIDIQHESPALPDWWRFDGAGCRPGALRADVQFGNVPGCADPWTGSGVAGFPSYTVTQPRGAANQARIKAGVGVLPSEPRTLAADTPYHAVRIVIVSSQTTGMAACAGCTGKACLVLNSLWIKRAPGAQGGDLFVSTPGPADANWAVWQDAGASCAAVPARRATWGSIKSLYR